VDIFPPDAFLSRFREGMNEVSIVPG